MLARSSIMNRSTSVKNWKVHTEFELYVVSGTNTQMYNVATIQQTVAQPNTTVYPYIRKRMGPVNMPERKPRDTKASIQARCHPLSWSFDMSVI